uniref:Predicted protein n=1 Tax=Hordeum vulgare subsp. vulgare TaxID=112509 RepID=F2DK81_HORVV|nr:predicted protein [Hordeum vulgare subsp. vulgare]
MKLFHLLIFSVVILGVFLPISVISTNNQENNEDDDAVDHSPVVEQIDEEEFVVSKQNPKSNPVKEQETIQEIKKLFKNDAEVPVDRNYIVEIIYVSIIVLYAVNFFNGKRKNDSIAASWIESVQPILSSNFSEYGKGQIVKESNYSYKVVAEGRQNCIGLQATLELRKRHDLLSVVTELLWKANDVLTIDVAMSDKAMEAFVFAVTKKKEDKRTKKASTDLNEFTSIYSVPSLPSMSILTETFELTDEILKPEIIAALNANENEFIKMHFSDQDTLSPKYKKMLHFQFRANDLNKLNTLTRMAIALIDIVADVNFNPRIKAKSDKNRSAATEKAEKLKNAQRQEAAQQRKFDKKQEEKKKWASLSPEEQAKREEKEAKKEQKKKMSKFAKVKFA